MAIAGLFILLLFVGLPLIAGLIFLLVFGIVRGCKRKKARRKEESGEDMHR